MAKARVVIADQNSAEFDALRRGFNSLLVILENIATEEAAGTTSAVQAAAALRDAISNGVDANAAPHVGTGRQLAGVKGSPVLPPRRAEEVVKLVEMVAADKY